MKFGSFLLILKINLIITQELDLNCKYDQNFNSSNIQDIILTRKVYQFINLAKYLKQFENVTINLTLHYLNITYLPESIFFNSYINNLNLSSNLYIKVIPVNFFNGIKFIKVLSFHNNKITDLDNFYINVENNLCGFLNLEELDLSNNEITSIKGNNFDKLKSLKILDLSANKIKNISYENFYKFEQVHILSLKDNEFILQDYIFENYSNLESLNIAGCGIKYFSSKSFYGLGKLKEVDISENNLVDYNENIFIEIRFLKKLILRRLNDYKDNIQKILKDILSLIYLEWLDLSDNRLKSLDEFYIGNFLNLERLELYKNNFESINKITLNHLQNLQYLDITSNDMIYIDDNSFENLTTLITLDLSFNLIETINKDTFYGLSNLLVLHLRSNEIGSIHEEAFIEMIELKDIDLSYNNIEILNFDLFFKGNKIENFNLKENKIKRIEFDFLKEAKKLVILQIWDNLIEELHICFLCMVKLRELKLSFNQIPVIPNFNNSNLWFINLEYNNIGTIESFAFNNLKNLVEINLINNPIKFIEVNAFFNCNNIKSIHLSVIEIGKASLLNLLNKLNNLNVGKMMDVNFFKSIYINDYEVFNDSNKLYCELIILFIRHRVFITQRLENLNDYFEELTMEHFIKNCLNLYMNEYDAFKLLN